MVLYLFSYIIFFFFLVVVVVVEGGVFSGNRGTLPRTKENRCLIVLFKSMGMSKGDHFQEKLI